MAKDRFPKKSTLNWNLEPGTSVKRTELHESFKGEVQGGISVSSLLPIVMLFSVAKRHNARVASDLWSKEQHGYSDGWATSDHRLLLYMGQGTVGDQSPDQRGNRSVIRHVHEGRDIRLFTPSSGVVRYVGRFICDPASPYETKIANDRLGQPRKVLLFRLIPMGKVAYELMPVIEHTSTD